MDRDYIGSLGCCSRVRPSSWQKDILLWSWNKTRKDSIEKEKPNRNKIK